MISFFCTCVSLDRSRIYKLKLCHLLSSFSQNHRKENIVLLVFYGMKEKCFIYINKQLLPIINNACGVKRISKSAGILTESYLRKYQQNLYLFVVPFPLSYFMKEYEYERIIFELEILSESIGNPQFAWKELQECSRGNCTK